MVSLIYKIINSSDLDMEPLYVYYSGQLENVKVFPDSHDTLSEIWTSGAINRLLGFTLEDEWWMRIGRRVIGQKACK